MTKKDFSFNKNCTPRKICSLCESVKLRNILKFSKTPLANSYPEKLNTFEKKFPLLVCICDDCKHVQLKYLVNPNLMFKNYAYVSGTSKVLIKHFENYFLKVKKIMKLNKNEDKILDIACNDGTFLNFFKKDGFKNVIGVEPASNLRRLNIKQGIKINTLFFNYKNSFLLKKKYKSFKIITANNVCAHIPSVKDFVLGIKNILHKDGVFIFEVSYLKDVIQKLTFDTIYHEHMSYHSLKPLISFFDKFQLSVVDFDLVKAQGGSIRVYVRHNHFKPKLKKITQQISKENKIGLFRKKLFINYYKKIKIQKNKVLNLINKQIYKKNKILVGYGAPAKVTTLSYVFDLNKKFIKYIVDDNPLKQNKYTPGKNIKIISFEKLKKIYFDYIIILAWNFAPSIIKKLKSSFKNKFKIIIPFPKLIVRKI